MTYHYTLILVLSILLTACSQAVTTPPGQDTDPNPSEYLSWSDPATWQSIKQAVPAEGSVVTIPENTSILLDTDTPDLAGLAIHGNLMFDEQDLHLRSDWIMISGSLRIGTKTKPFQHHATITLTGNDPDKQSAVSNSMGNKGIGVMGGKLYLYGATKTAWTRLAKTAPAGATELTLAQNVNWQAGDHIIIASSDFDYEQAEERIIKSVNGNRVTLDIIDDAYDTSLKRPLEFEHWGEQESFAGRVLDERAEVGLLSRNIVIQGDEASEDAGFGGHVMIMRGSTAHISGVEFYRMGQRGELGRYPLHWHLAGDISGSFIEQSAIHRSFNRCVTVHGTHNGQVRDVVAYDAYGHCFFLEDGIEQGNVLEGNLGVLIQKPDSEYALLPSDIDYMGPAVYWITNPSNTVINNVAAGSEGSGFWVALPEHPTGPSATDTVWPRRMPLTEFSGNVSHSNNVDGLHVDRGPDENGNVDTAYYRALEDPQDEESAVQTVVFDTFTAYKNRNRGMWLRGQHHLITGAVLADNAIGATFASDETIITDSLFVGESRNEGTPKSWELTGTNGRSLPKPWACDDIYECAKFPIRGFEFYDGLVGVSDSHFANFIPNKDREASAISYLNFTDFSVHPDNYAKNLSFDNSKRVFMATRPAPADPTQGSEDGYRSAVFLDQDGSISGSANTYVVVDNPFMIDTSCSKQNNWNTWLCPDKHYGAFALRTSNPELELVRVAREDGVDHVMFGSGRAPGTYFRTLLETNATYEVTPEDALPESFSVYLLDAPSSWLRVRVPYAGVMPEVSRYGRVLTPVSDLAALDDVTESSYYYDVNEAGGTLYLQLVASGTYETLMIEKNGAPPPVTGTGTGLTGHYFDTKDFEGPSITRIDPTIHFEWRGEAPFSSMDSDLFSIRWTGYVEATESARYTFTTISDDGVRLSVCGQQLIDDWNDHSETENSGSINMSAGQRCPITLEYFEGYGWASIALFWQYNQYAAQLIPKQQLYAR